MINVLRKTEFTNFNYVLGERHFVHHSKFHSNPDPTGQVQGNDAVSLTISLGIREGNYPVILVSLFQR